MTFKEKKGGYTKTKTLDLETFFLSLNREKRKIILVLRGKR